jgi:aminoglycoside phosphotransferase family enzyme
MSGAGAPVGVVETDQVALAAKVAFLSAPASYPEVTRTVETVETHMSWVFLTERHAYKLKKPVRLEFVDYTTLAARTRYCREEVRINQALAPRVYLGCLPLTRAAGGQLQLGDDAGQVVDQLVQMCRLPVEARLDVLIAKGAVDRGLLRQALDRLTEFYTNADPVGLGPAVYRARLVRAIEHNRAALARPGPRLDRGMIASILARQLRFVEDASGPLVDRAQHVVEAHGDLRPEHVYLLDPPLLVDRLEFDRELRLLDPADELAFLALESSRLGAPWLARIAFDRYEGRSGDRVPPSVASFYRSLRACMRARLAVGHLDQPDGPPSSWHLIAADYLEIAAEATRELAEA